MGGQASADGVSIRARNVEFGYGDGFTLRVPELSVPKGQRAVIIGPSGCGKTTFLHLCAGILPGAHGTIEVEGVDVGAASEAERRAFRVSTVGLVFQEFELLDHLRVRENVLLPYLAHPELDLDAAVEHRADDLLKAAGLDDKARRRPRELSQGERQRVAICRALVTAPQLVLADEPTGNLDPRTTRVVLEMLLRETRARHATLLVVTHDHGLLDAFDAVIDFEQLSQESPA